MKVIILHPPLYKMDHDLFNQLGKYVDLTVYCFGEHPRLHIKWSIHDFKKQAENYKIKVWGKGAVNIKTQMSLPAIISLIKEKPDAVMSVAFWLPSLYSSLLSKIFRWKFFILTDATSITEESRSFLRKYLRKIISRNTDAVISASEHTTKYINTLNSHLPVRESLQTINVSEWMKKIDELPLKTDLRSVLSIPENKNVILGIGNFIYRKNWISVMRNIMDIDNTIFVLIGDGELELEYKTYILDNGLDSKVILIPRVDKEKIHEYYKAADIFVLPSYQDQFGYVVEEALSSGLPVLCSFGAGASTLIKDDYNGFVFDPGKDYSSMIRRALAEMESMRENARTTMADHTIENKALEYTSILEEFVC